MAGGTVPSVKWTAADLTPWLQDMEREFGCVVSLSCRWSSVGDGSGQWLAEIHVFTPFAEDEETHCLFQTSLDLGKFGPQGVERVLAELVFRTRWELECLTATRWLPTA